MARRWLAASLLTCALHAAACGDDDAPPGVVNNREPQPDASTPQPDASEPVVIRDPNADRDVPAELKDQKCAVELDKLYELSTVHRQAEPAQLAADRVGSRFAMSYVGQSDTCLDAIMVASLQGSDEGGKPVLATALDPCSKIVRAALAHNGKTWLLGSVDTRMGAQDLWVQTYDDKGKLGTAHRVSDTNGEESEPVLAMSTGGKLLAAWVEQDERLGVSELLVRSLASDGAPLQDVVSLERAPGVTFSSLALSPLGPYVALGYRRSELDGPSRIVLEVLEPATGERVREAWTLTAQAGANGTVDIAGDADGGGVLYSVIAPPSHQLWFQTLGPDGLAAPVTNGDQNGGPSAATRVLGPPNRAIDGAVTKIPAGFALAYRSLQGGLIASPQIRVHFLDRFGREGGSSSVALAHEYGGRTAIKTGYDGRLVISWSDTSDEGDTTLMAVRVPCVGNVTQ